MKYLVKKQERIFNDVYISMFICITLKVIIFRWKKKKKNERNHFKSADGENISKKQGRIFFHQYLFFEKLLKLKCNLIFIYSFIFCKVTSM